MPGCILATPLCPAGWSMAAHLRHTFEKKLLQLKGHSA